MSPARPAIPIRAVAELTGIPVATLRAWERRYGIPAPTRSTSGHRLYGDRDVELARRLRRMVDEGVPPKVAAERLRRAPPAATAPPPPPELDPYAIVVDRIMAALDRFDPEAFETELRRGVLLGSTLDVHARVMVPVMHRLGERWIADDPLSIAQEHLASEVMRSVAQDLHRLARPAEPVGQAVIACVADEEHVLPLYAIAFQLAHRRIRSVVLGARTPPAAIAVAVERLSPTLVALSTTVPPAPERARALIDAYGRACDGTPWIVGGAGAPAFADGIAAHGGAVVGGALTLDRFIDGLRLVR
ncbi:MAG: MerR family transcriptional regulator [Myxococcales bacterium]|nr:MerR family transcriptional regulator [Myxococcales bacterium]